MKRQRATAFGGEGKVHTSGLASDSTAKRRRRGMPGGNNTHASWARLRIQEELTKEREKKDSLVWFLQELLAEMEQLIAQDKQQPCEEPEGWVRDEVKLRTYKQFLSFPLSGRHQPNDVAITPAYATTPNSEARRSFSLHESHGVIPLLSHSMLSEHVKAEPRYASADDDAAMAADLIPEVSAPEECELEQLQVLPAPPLACLKESNLTESWDELDFLTVSDDDISIFLNLPDGDDCSSSSQDSSGDECFAASHESDSGYTGSPSLDFTSGSAAGSESWDDVAISNCSRALLQEREKATHHHSKKNESDTEDGRSGSVVDCDPEATTPTDSECPDWAGRRTGVLLMDSLHEAIQHW